MDTYVKWHQKMSGKSHLLLLRYTHFCTAENKVNKQILTDIINFIFILENGNSGMFGIILKLVLQGRGLYQNVLFIEMQLSTHFVVPGHIWSDCSILESIKSVTVSWLLPGLSFFVLKHTLVRGGGGKARFNVATPTNATATCFHII